MELSFSVKIVLKQKQKPVKNAEKFIEIISYMKIMASVLGVPQKKEIQKGEIILASKGTIAKQNVAEALKNAFGEDFLGEVDKKLYMNVPDENGQKIQIAVTLTCPKTPVAADRVEPLKPVPPKPSTYEFGKNFTPPPSNNSTLLSQEERDNIANLMAQLGL